MWTLTGSASITEHRIRQTATLDPWLDAGGNEPQRNDSQPIDARQRETEREDGSRAGRAERGADRAAPPV